MQLIRDFDAQRHPNKLMIESTDRINVLYAGGNNIVVDITELKGPKGEMKKPEKHFRIEFEDNETIEYFFEKFKKEWTKRRDKMGNKIESARLKIANLNREIKIVSGIYGK